MQMRLQNEADGTVDRYKARLVAQGYSQDTVQDYENTFAPVARYNSIRSVLAIANQLNLDVHQMDVKTAFLHGDLEHETSWNSQRAMLIKTIQIKYADFERVFMA